jgi:hypothetical protein
MAGKIIHGGVPLLANAVVVGRVEGDPGHAKRTATRTSFVIPAATEIHSQYKQIQNRTNGSTSNGICRCRTCALRAETQTHTRKQPYIYIQLNAYINGPLTTYWRRTRVL